MGWVIDYKVDGTIIIKICKSVDEKVFFYL